MIFLVTFPEGNMGSGCKSFEFQRFQSVGRGKNEDKANCTRVFIVQISF